MEIKGSLSGNQEYVVCFDGHDSFLDGRLAGIGSPVQGVGGEAILKAKGPFLLGERTQEPLDLIASVRKRILDI